jgi:hypothetical protein
MNLNQSIEGHVEEKNNKKIKVTPFKIRRSIVAKSANLMEQQMG